MENKIRRIRTENYFIEALCDIIRNDGMGAATIRNVADKAGYNSATLYTYFSSFSHLLIRAHFVFELELLDKIKIDTMIDTNKNIIEVWTSAYISMADYYLQNPHIFECIFISTYENCIPNELRDMHNEQSEFVKYVNQFLEKVSEIAGINTALAQKLNQACLSLTVGTVLLHLKERLSEPHKEVLNNLSAQVKYFIEGQINAKRVVTENEC